jgi:polysaccharide export outer membrane protein
MRTIATFIVTLLALICPLRAQDSAVIRANDKLELKVAGEEDMTSQLTVGADGSVNVNFIGRVKVRGMNVDDAASLIRSELIKKRYFVDPQVSVNISAAAKMFCTVLGQVNKAGQIEFPADGKMDLLAAIAGAGGFSKIANPSKVTVKRAKGARETYDTKKLSDPVPIYPGDVVDVAESRF